MKSHIVPALLVMLVVPGVLAAQTTPVANPKTGITFSVGSASGDLSFRRVLGPRWAALATVGYSDGSAYALTPTPAMPAGTSLDITAWSVGLAARHYATETELRPFLELGGGVSIADSPACSGETSPYGSGGGGVEYKIAPRVSIEGTAGVAYRSFSQRCDYGGTEYKIDQHSFSTFRTALSVTFYF